MLIYHLNFINPYIKETGRNVRKYPAQLKIDNEPIILALIKKQIL